MFRVPDDGDPFAQAERSDKGVPVKLTPTKESERRGHEEAGGRVGR